MGKLTREELLELKGSYYEGDKAIDTALILYAENEKMKAGIEGLKGRVIEAHDEGVDDGMKVVMDKIEKLREKWGKQEYHWSHKRIVAQFLQDLADITGVKR